MEEKISKATLARMPLYLHFLQEEYSKGEQYISSTVIAQNISVSSVLVRKDLALVSSEAGRPRMGFAIGRLIVDIEKFWVTTPFPTPLSLAQGIWEGRSLVMRAFDITG